MSESAPSLLPSGAQHHIAHGDQQATVVEVGGGLREYLVGGQPLLDGYGEQESCGGGRGQPLIPWPNRLEDGRYEFDGERHQLPLSEPKTRTAIHGLVRWANWTAVESEPARVVMAHVLHPQSGWPGTLALAIEYSLSDDGITVTTNAVNAGARACPFGAGVHPYLTLGTDTIDAIRLTAPGRRYLTADERGLPTGARDVNGTELDFRTPRRLGAARLDHAFSELERDRHGRANVSVETPDAARSATLWLDEGYRYLMLFTGDTLPADQRRRGLAVEPMTCPPNALRTGDDLLRLEPGESFTASWGIQPG